jgi:PAS domain S-box-containing protein
MNYEDKTKEELIIELQELQRVYSSLKIGYEKNITAGRLIGESLLKLLKAVDTSSDAIFLTDTEGLITYVNNGFTTLYGYTADEVIGKLTPRIIKSGLLEKEVYIDFWKMLKSKKEVKGEIQNKRKNGEIVFIDGTASPILDERNAIIGFLGIQRDITERKHVEEQLKHSNNQIKTILESAGEGILGIDMNGVQTFVNPKAAALFGYKIEDMIGKPSHSMWHHSRPDKSHLPQEECQIYATLKNGKIHSGEGYFWQKNGTGFFVDYTSVPIIENDLIIGAVVTFLDITARKKAELQIQQQNQELQELIATKNKFFSIVSHDLRSPFISFLCMTEILAKELSTMTPDEIQDIVDNIRTSAINMFRLLENMLQWTMMQQGLITYNPKLILLLPVVNESIALVLELAKNKKIEITYDIPDGIEVFADGIMLQSLIMNLVSNAVKFSQKGGKIHVSAIITDDNNVVTAIRDSGIGMSPTVADNLFRFGAETSRKGTEGEPSTGLGLLICKDFIEKHGGNIWVESEEGKGSTFYFSLPFIERARI